VVAAITRLKESPPSDLLFGRVLTVGFRLAGSTTLSHAIIILNYETDRIISEAR
jgi:hypothetical protein